MDALFCFSGQDTSPARRDAAKKALENAQKLNPNSSDTLLALGYYQYWMLHDYGAAKTTFGRVGKMFPGNSEEPQVLAMVTRREGHSDESVAYFEQALAPFARAFFYEVAQNHHAAIAQLNFKLNGKVEGDHVSKQDPLLAKEKLAEG